MTRIVILYLLLLSFSSAELKAQTSTTTTTLTVTPIVTPVIVTPYIVSNTVFQYLPALQPAPTAAAYQQQQQNNDIDRMVRERVDAILRERFGAPDKGPPKLILPAEYNNTAKDNKPVEDLTEKVANMLATKSCVRCHTEGVRTAGKISLFTKKSDGLFFQPTATKVEIAKMLRVDPTTGRSQMPPNGDVATDPNHPEALKQEDRALLQRWFEQK